MNAITFQKHFTELPLEEQIAINHKDLRELRDYYGGWDNLRAVIKDLEDNDNEAAYERRTSGGSDAWSGGFVDNH